MRESGFRTNLDRKAAVMVCHLCQKYLDGVVWIVGGTMSCLRRRCDAILQCCFYLSYGLEPLIGLFVEHVPHYLLHRTRYHRSETFEAGRALIDMLVHGLERI